MAAANLDLVVEQGATFSTVFSFFDEGGTAVDVSTWTFRGQIRAYESSSTILASFVFAAGPTTNAVVCTISDENTALIPVPQEGTGPERVIRTCIYDIEAEKVDGTVDRIFQGNALVSGEVTR